MTPSQQLQQYLTKRDLLVKTLAQELGVFPSTVSRWLHGKTRISPVYQRMLRKKGILT